MSESVLSAVCADMNMRYDGSLIERWVPLHVGLCLSFFSLELTKHRLRIIGIGTELLGFDFCY